MRRAFWHLGLLILLACGQGSPKLSPEEAGRVWTVDEALATPSLMGKPALRVSGRVLPGSLSSQGDGAERRWSFRIAGASAILEVRFVGFAPDTLHEGNQGEFRGTLLQEDGGTSFLRAVDMSLRSGNPKAAPSEPAQPVEDDR